MATALILASAIAGAGLAVPELRTLGRAWGWVVLFLVWAGPLLLLAWAAAAASRTEPVGPDVAIAIGGAGAALSFALALGPEARYLAEPIGRAPYWLLTELSSSFEGTRVPARFGGISLLFLAMMAAGALAALARARRPGLRLLSAGAGVVALVACFAELPVGSLPRGRELVDLPELKDPAYAWLQSQPGRFGILELPDWPTEGPQHWRHRAWRSLRYMLASKQHGQHLVNGTGRIEPFLWTRFRRLELWSDGFFAFVASYLPVKVRAGARAGTAAFRAGRGLAAHQGTCQRLAAGVPIARRRADLHGRSIRGPRAGRRSRVRAARDRLAGRREVLGPARRQ